MTSEMVPQGKWVSMQMARAVQMMWARLAERLPVEADPIAMMALMLLMVDPKNPAAFDIKKRYDLPREVLRIHAELFADLGVKEGEYMGNECRTELRVALGFEEPPAPAWCIPGGYAYSMMAGVFGLNIKISKVLPEGVVLSRPDVWAQRPDQYVDALPMPMGPFLSQFQKADAEAQRAGLPCAACGSALGEGRASRDGMLCTLCLPLPIGWEVALACDPGTTCAQCNDRLSAVGLPFPPMARSLVTGQVMHRYHVTNSTCVAEQIAISQVHSAALAQQKYSVSDLARFGRALELVLAERAYEAETRAALDRIIKADIESPQAKARARAIYAAVDNYRALSSVCALDLLDALGVYEVKRSRSRHLPPGAGDDFVSTYPDPTAPGLGTWLRPAWEAYERARTPSLL